MKPSARLLAVVFVLSLAACHPATPAPAPPPPPGPYPYAPYGQPYPPPPNGQPYAPGPVPAPGPAPAPAPVQRPLLAPLIGTPAMQQEIVSVLGELVNALPPQQQALVRGIPMTFDPTEEVNAYAGCDDSGQPFLAATAGILEAIDAIAQTKATDELFGTRTYDAYCSAVLPQLVRGNGARAGLPAGVIPANYGGDARRWSRAHEMFDDIVAFTFGHELGHHYLGHTGCAKGQPLGPGPDPTKLGRLLSVVPLFNQVNEAAADSAGVNNSLDAGRRRRPQFEWSEAGAVTLLDYFARIDSAGGAGGPLSLLSPVQFLRDHPNPLARIPLVQTVAANWHRQHP